MFARGELFIVEAIALRIFLIYMSKIIYFVYNVINES